MNKRFESTNENWGSEHWQFCLGMAPKNCRTEGSGEEQIASDQLKMELFFLAGEDFFAGFENTGGGETVFFHEAIGRSGFGVGILNRNKFNRRRIFFRENL